MKKQRATRVLRILKAARKLLEPRGAWTQGSAARNLYGERVDPLLSASESWCLYGAIEKAGSKSVLDRRNALQAIENEIPHERHITYWNDRPSRRKGQVLKLLDKAIEAAS